MPSRLFVSKLLLAACSLLVLAGCTKERPAWPAGQAEVDTIKVKEGVVTVPAALTNAAKVAKNQLSFPASMASDVMAKWPTGAVMVGQPAADVEGRRTNPFGFLRKVTGVRVEGDAVIVDTEPALLEDAVTGDYHHEFDVASTQPLVLPDDIDLSAYDVPVTLTEGTAFPAGLGAGVTQQPLEVPSTGLTLFGKQRQGLTAGGPTLAIPEIPIALMSYNKKWNTPENRPGVGINLSGSVKVTPLVSMSPRLTLDVSVGIRGLSHFEFSVGGDLKVGARYDINYAAVPEPATSLVEAASINELLARSPIKLNAPPVELGKPTETVVGSIGPVPVVQKTGAYLVCELNFKGAVHVKGEVSARISPRMGVQYDRDDGWTPIAEFPLVTPTVTGDVISGRGGLELDCGVVVRVDLLVADAAGPYAQIRRDVVAHAEYAEVCPALSTDRALKSHVGDSKLTMGLKSYDALQVGVELDIAHVISIGKGPYDVLRRNYPADGSDLMSKTRTGVREGNGRLGVGVWCVVPCDDRVKGGSESDVDCGGICGKCSGGKTCGVPADCLSGACDADGTCAASRCEDHLKNDEETDIDCGGPTCRACPYYLPAVDGSLRPVTCALDRDCELGFCSADAVTPKTCTVNLCRDGKVSGSEPSIDCGASDGCTSLCSTGSRCNTAADCSSHACNIMSGLCVATTCLDGVRNGDEGDVDCGGSCPTKCATGQLCGYNQRGDADCASGVCRTPPLSSADGLCVATTCEDRRVDGNEVGLDCGGSCAARCPIGETCSATPDCVAGALCNVKSRRCALPGCDDNVKNGQESSVDCGGPSCLKCAISKACNANADCVTNTCSNGKCVGGPCENGVKDTGEADVDCGGSCTLPCATGLACAVARDCASNLCVGNTCISDACRDRVRNGGETDADCGGTTCIARCTAGQTCSVNADCSSSLCNTTTRTCVADACHDGLLTAATESDIDCGGSCATKCEVNRVCTAGGDCVSGVCNATTGRCVPNGCFDGVKNGSETDLDCGGNCDPKCAVNKTCAAGTDCQSGACIAMTSTCAADQCSDGRINGNETAVDCGGQCATKCAVGGGCLSGADCANPQGMVGLPGFCSVSTRTCAAISCADGTKDGDETGVDCGGSCGKCAVGGGCATGTDCTSTFCNVTTHVCAADQCGDGLKNGTETDIDCGGDTCGGCADNKACVNPWDCGSGYCGTTNLCIPAYPRSCAELYLVQYLRTDGVYIIDPDGPRTRVTGADKGANPPMATYCKMADDPNGTPGGWTPVYYANTQGNVTAPFLTHTRRNNASPWDGFCAVGSTCPGAGDSCREDNGGGACTTGACHCVGASVADPFVAPGLRGNPINYSVQTGDARDAESFSYRLASSSTPTIGYRGYGSPSSVSQLRVTAYRNGVQVFDSQLQTTLGPSTGWDGYGQVVVENLSVNNTFDLVSNVGWCQLPVNGSGLNPEAIPWGWPNVPAYPYNDDVTPSVRGAEGGCRRFGKNLSTSVGLGGGLPTGVTVDWAHRWIPGGVNGGTAAATPYVGLWLARYGTDNSSYTWPAYPIPPKYGAFRGEMGYIGICNGMTSTTDVTARRTQCSPYQHPFYNSAGQYQPITFGTGELTGDVTKGSNFGSWQPGMVIVIWARY